MATSPCSSGTPSSIRFDTLEHDESPGPLPSQARPPRRLKSKSKKDAAVFGTVGVSSTEHLFKSDDVGALERHLRKTRIVSKGAANIASAEGPQEIIDWLCVCCEQFWADHGSICLEVCLLPAFAPEICTPMLEAVTQDELSASEPPSRQLSTESTFDSDALCCLEISCNGETSKDNGACTWFGVEGKHRCGSWCWRNRRDHPALLTTLQKRDIVQDMKGPRGWGYVEHANASCEQSVLYIPLNVRDELVGALRIASTIAQHFSPPDCETFRTVAEVTAVHLQVLRVDFELERDRAELKQLSEAYREMLNDLLPSHVVDELRDVRSASKSRRRSGGQAVGMHDSRQMNKRNSLRSMDESKSLQITGQLDKLAYAEYHKCVAIIFSDVKGFTSMSERAHPAEIMLMLDDMFGRFDGIIDDHSPFAYKVETVGDAYMVACGLEMREGGCKYNDDASIEFAVALRAIFVASEMVKAAQKVRTPPQGHGRPIEIRVGVHLGKIMSGIIGRKVPRYCMFGDTVNTASRMESNGVPGQIHVSGRVREACMLGVLGKVIDFQSTGGMEVKGKGWMHTYLIDPLQPTMSQLESYLPSRSLPIVLDLSSKKFDSLYEDSAPEWTPELPSKPSEDQGIHMPAPKPRSTNDKLACGCFAQAVHALCLWSPWKKISMV